MRDGRFVCPCSVGYGEGGTVGFCVGRLVCADVMIKGWYSSCTALYAKVFLVVACLCLFDFFLVGFLDGFLVGLLLGLLEGYAEYPALRELARRSEKRAQASAPETGMRRWEPARERECLGAKWDW